MNKLNFNGKIKKTIKFIWPIKIFFITFSLSLFFSITSESILKNSNLIMAIFLIVFLFFAGTIFDIIGVASAACTIEKYKKICKDQKYALIGIYIINHADKISSFCCDIVGDMCGILSGSAGAAIVLKLSISGNSLQIIVSSLISSAIASIIVWLKSLGKLFAVQKSSVVVYMCNKIVFNISNKLKKNA